MNSDRITHHSHVTKQPSCGCIYDCPDVHHFLRLTEELIHTSLKLEEEVIRWCQALIKYLPPDWAEGLHQDILCNLSRDFEGESAYDFYVNFLCGGKEPQQDKARLARLRRLMNGTDETSITYL